MKSSSKFLNLVGLLFIGLALLSCKPEGNRAGNLQTGVNISPQQTPAQSVSVLPTPTIDTDVIQPTPAPPSPTPPPVPTPLPTPVVTPIPVASPPFIPEVVGKAQQPFWIYYWKDNEVWRIDDQGNDQQLMIDTYKQLGQYLTDIPDPYKNSDCCWIGPRVTVSPDGQKLALVVVDKIKGRMSDRFTFSIYVFDVATRDLKLLSEGTQPVWSPDIRHIAFLKNRGLWIADLDTWQVRERIAASQELDMHITEYAWSPDNTQIAYLYNFSMQRLPTIWVIYIDSPESARQLVNLDSGYIYGITWTPNAEQIIYFSTEGARDSRYIHDEPLWSVSLETGQRTQLTRDMMLRGGFISPDGKWLFYSGYQLYTQGMDAQARDLWLMSVGGKDLHRIQTNQNFGAAGWSPDGTRLVLARNGIGLETLSLTDGKVTQISSVGNNADYALGGVK